MTRTSNQCVRIIGGQWRRRQLHFPALAGLRPTADAVRERLFNWLGQDLTGWRCLDLFAGSGALGFEAASRGAASVWLVEQDGAACAAIEANRRLLVADNTRVIRANALAWLKQHRPESDAQRFDLITLDPPFALDVQSEVLCLLDGFVRASGTVYVEHDGSLSVPAGWQIWRQGRTGKAHYCLLRQESDESSPTDS